MLTAVSTTDVYAAEKLRVTVAIIGGGQLGMFLCRAARDVDLDTVVITPDSSAPANEFADQTVISKLTAPGLAGRIAKLADVVTFEFEDVPEPLLDGLAAEEQRGTLRVHPSLDILRLLNNKARQKQWLTDSGFPTLEFLQCMSPAAEQHAIANRLGYPLVQKSASGGYDGYGVQILKDASDLDKLWDVPSIFEPCIERPTELAVVVARSAAGECMAYPAVRMNFHPEKNVLDAVIAPAGFDSEIEQAARDLATNIANRLDAVGVLAVEMFLVDGQLLVNEISPRVHNSGHHTLESSNVSQFEQHMRAVSGMPLIEPELLTPALMQNLLWSDDMEPMLGCPPGALDSLDPDVVVHWYGKQEARTGRKMGHVTCLCGDEEEALRRVTTVLKSICDPAAGATA